MKRYSALFCIFMAAGLTSGQEPDSTEQVKKGTRHILRFCTNDFNNVSKTESDKLKIPALSNESLSLKIINELKEITPENLNSEIYDLPNNATAEQFFNALKKIEENIKPTDEVLIYISSYGVEYSKKIRYRYGDNDNGQSLFIATNEPTENWISMVELAKLLSKSKLKPVKKLVIANCSRIYLGQSDDNTTIGKKWTNNNESNEKDENGRLIINNDLAALEEGKTNLDLNMAIIFSCSSGLGTTSIRSKDVGQRQENKDIFETTLNKILTGGQQGYNSLENLFENVKRKTNITTIRQTGKPQVPTMIVFARDPEAYTDMVQKWQIGTSAKPEINDEFDDPDLNINSTRIRTIEDAIGKTKKIDSVLVGFQKTLEAIPQISKINGTEIYQPFTGEKLMAAAKIVGTGESIAARFGAPTYGIGGYLGMAAGLAGGIRQERRTIEYQEPDKKQLEEIKMSFDSTANDLKKAAKQLKETDNAIKQNRIDYSLIDLTKLFEENQKLRNQLGLDIGLVEEQPQPQIYVPRRRGFFR